MMEQSFTFEEFEQEQPEEVVLEEIDVQKAVVESLAEEKVILEDRISEFKNKIGSLLIEIENFKKEICSKNEEIAVLKQELSRALSNVEEVESRNPNQLALLDRDIELPDRFPGETRDQVIEVIKIARDKAEEEGRVRLAQILESVLVNNEPHGNLLKRKVCLQDLFTQNMNIVNGVVIEKLKEMGISYRKGETYLSASEIMARNF